MNRRIIAVVAALALAVLGTAGVLTYIRMAESKAVAGKQSLNVLLVSERIPAGTTGKKIRTDGLAKVVRMPAASVPPGALGSLSADFDKQVLISDIQPQQMLLSGHFGTASKVSGGLVLPDGKVAVSLPALANATVASYIVPGSKVALFDTFTVMGGGGQGNPLPTGNGLARDRDADHATRLLLPSVEVVAVGVRGDGGQTSSGGGEAASSSESSKAQGKVLITVAVTQAEAEKILHATTTGIVNLALVSETSKVAPSAGVDNNSLFK